MSPSSSSRPNCSPLHPNVFCRVWEPAIFIRLRSGVDCMNVNFAKNSTVKPPQKLSLSTRRPRSSMSACWLVKHLSSKCSSSVSPNSHVLVTFVKLLINNLSLVVAVSNFSLLRTDDRSSPKISVLRLNLGHPQHRLKHLHNSQGLVIVAPAYIVVSCVRGEETNLWFHLFFVTFSHIR